MSFTQSAKDKLKLLPSEPGVYKMLDKSGQIIYVGKAKNLKNRVGSYFLDLKSHGVKVLRMLEKAEDFDYIVAGSETEALILECNLIKQHMPRYNILLKGQKLPFCKGHLAGGIPEGIVRPKKAPRRRPVFRALFQRRQGKADDRAFKKRFSSSRTAKNPFPGTSGRNVPA